ncbi:MAG TPA: hypothetical protein VGD71_38185 [Kribbella sp.]|jgi:hypothetical protein
MEGHVVAEKCVLTLTRDELILLVSAITTLNGALTSDLAYKDMVGRERSEVMEFATKLAEFAREIPPGPRFQ